MAQPIDARHRLGPPELWTFQARASLRQSDASLLRFAAAPSQSRAGSSGTVFEIFIPDDENLVNGAEPANK